jgi:hypothetical protein
MILGWIAAIYCVVSVVVGLFAMAMSIHSWSDVWPAIKTGAIVMVMWPILLIVFLSKG